MIHEIAPPDDVTLIDWPDALYEVTPVLSALGRQRARREAAVRRARRIAAGARPPWELRARQMRMRSGLAPQAILVSATARPGGIPMVYRAPYLGALGRRRRKKGFFESMWSFHKRMSPVAWLGRQKVIRKILPRPVSTIMRGEFEQVPGAVVRELKAPLKPVMGLFAGGRGRHRRGESAVPEDTSTMPPTTADLFLTPQPSLPAPPAPSSMRPGEFAPASAQPAAEMIAEDYGIPPSPEEMMGPEAPTAEEYLPEEEAIARGLIPSAAEVPYPGVPTALLPATAEVPAGGELMPEEFGPGPSAELLVEEEGSPAELEQGERLGSLGQVRWWYQPPGFGPPEFGLGAEAPQWFTRASRVVSAAAPIIAREIRGGRVVAAAAPAATYARVPPTGGMPLWVWPVLGVGALGVLWVMWPQPRRRRQRVR
jgi:hypothetical protein